MNRGAGRKPVFKTVEQRHYFLSLLADTCQRFNAEWHAYCLMGNHYHLLVRTPEGNLQRIMRHIDGLYTQFFNRSERRDGPLFRGRYKAILVDAEGYWLSVSRYLHRNPLEAGLVGDLEHYPWSSYPAYIGLKSAPAWLTTEYILQAIGRRDRHRRYAAYVMAGLDEDLVNFYQRPRVGPILGDATFKAKVLAGQHRDIDRPELRAARVYPSVAQIIAAVCRQLRVDEDSIWRPLRGKGVTSPARAMAMYLCQQVADMRLSAIAKTFNLTNYASAGAAVRNFKQRLAEDKWLAGQIKLILLDLTP